MTAYSSYVLSSYLPLINLSIDEILQIGNNQIENSNPIPSFDEDLLINLCLDAEKTFGKEDNILKIDGDVFIVGDIHGSFHDLLRILNYIESNPSKVLFLGDYVDRGEFSLECITLLFALKIEFPDKYFLIRGNHEFDTLCSQYGFKKEILNHHNPNKTNYHKMDDEFQIQKQFSHKNNIHENDENNISTEISCDNYFTNHININCHKYTEKLYQSFINAFAYLPLAALVNTTTFCVHGGLSPELNKIEKIQRSIQRPIHQYESNQLLADILWGDPSETMKYIFNDNQRGCGKLFNGAALIQFLKTNGLNRIIRGHECVKNGVHSIFNEKLITIFSSSSYNQEMGNKCGMIKIKKDKDDFESIIFPPIHKLHKCDTKYHRVEAFERSYAYSQLFPRSPMTKSVIFDSECTTTQMCSPMNFKAIFCKRRISFNTGIQHKKPSLVVPKTISPHVNFVNFANMIKNETDKITNVGTSPIPLMKKCTF